MMGLRLLEKEREWQYEHRDDTQVPGLIATCVSTTITSVIILTLRLLSRRLSQGCLHLEVSDWLILIAWVFLMIMDVSWSVGTRYGIGRHAVVITDMHIIQILAVICEAAYFLAIAFIKFSILALYLRAFPTRRFRHCVWGVAMLVIGWAMAGAMMAIFQCPSIDDIWRPESQEFCIDCSAKSLVIGIINIITDIIILAMVLPVSWRLLITKRNKWMGLVALAAGSSACIITVLRLPYAIKLDAGDETWDTTPTFILSVIEITVGMLAVSMPTYLPLYKHIFGRVTCTSRTDTRACKYKESLRMGFYNVGAQNDVNVTSPGTHMGTDHGGINVTNHIELVRHTNRSGNWVRVTDEDEEGLCKAESKFSEGSRANNMP